MTAESFIHGVEGAPGGAPGRPVPRMAGLPLPTRAPAEKSRDGIEFARYANARPSTGQLVDVHVARIGPDGTVRIDGNPDPAASLRQRCPVLSCLQMRTNYPGHLCLQPDGTEVWQDWPTSTTTAPGRRSTC